MQYWLMKTEPDVFSIDDLMKAPNQTEHWDGIRNYQARNFMKDQMQVGDKVLFYHSNAKPSAIVGTAVISREGYPDDSAWDPEGEYFDPKSTPEHPVWMMVDVQFESRFTEPLPLERLREVPALAEMMLLKRGSRLSVQPVTAAEFKAVLKLAGPPAAKASAKAAAQPAATSAAKKAPGSRPR